MGEERGNREERLGLPDLQTIEAPGVLIVTLKLQKKD
jgi:hypothetical protein